ncbi:DUF4157 domain-containing protein [Mucilaginibacter sp. SG564]|uniref:eCIS core domain-containing protein n=1 Tax=Mucilaginibacter sp. SG564 TaxID=2587022 RepID=UPI00155322A0|nr:hypothetical protein [Mucilaginibacter sp. SG564]
MDSHQHIKLVGKLENHTASKSLFFQPKLSVNQPNDIYEQEANHVADRVMRMAVPAHNEKAFFKSSDGIQRKCQHCEDEVKLHRKESPNADAHSGHELNNYIGSLGASGQTLSENSRRFFEPRFGHDFSDVRIHTDTIAAKSAQSVNALAYTTGNNIVFNNGQYSPDSDNGKKLLAHELTHVVQQEKTRPLVQRKIMVGNTAMTVDDQYKKIVKDTFGDKGLEIVLGWHNNGAGPEYDFKDWEAYRTEIRIRSNAIKGMDIANDKSINCCHYPTKGHPGGTLNPFYWDKTEDYHFIAKVPFPAGKNSSDAIEDMFRPNAGTELECLTLSVAVEYYALLQALGKDKFNKMFPAGAGLVIANSGADLLKSLVGSDKFEELPTKQKISELIPGDHGYFKNFADYGAKHPNGLWQGENVIYYGNGKFRGFGIGIYDEDTILDRLVYYYNKDLDDKDKKTKTDLIKEGGGFTGWVTRPSIKQILK